MFSGAFAPPNKGTRNVGVSTQELNTEQLHKRIGSMWQEDRFQTYSSIAAKTPAPSEHEPLYAWGT